MLRKKRGFTLIELLVVIAIIAILAAILFPVFANAKKSAMRSACLSNVKQIGLSLNMYVDDSGGKYPAANLGKCPAGITSSDWDSPDAAHLATGLIWALRHHVKNQKMWMCSAGGQRAYKAPKYTVPPGRQLVNSWPQFVGWMKGPGIGTVSTNYSCPPLALFTEAELKAAKENNDPNYDWCAQGKTPIEFYLGCKKAHQRPWLLYDSYDPKDPNDPSDKEYFAPHQGGFSCLNYDGSVTWYKDSRIGS